MAKQYLIESLTLDTSKDITPLKELKESFNGKTLLVEGENFSVLNVYKVPISRPGERNKNGRTYTLEGTWKPVLEKKMGENSIGLLNHPKPGEAPDFRDSACVWRNIRVEHIREGKPVIYADMYVLNDKRGNGDLIEAVIKAGGAIDVSTRGYGELSSENIVENFELKSVDIVTEGSYSVTFDHKDRIQSPGVTVVGESEKSESVKNNEKLQEENTNNQRFSSSDKGDNIMLNKIIIRKAINEAFNQSNKFSAFNELNAIMEELKAEKGVEDLAKLTQEKIDLLNGALTEAYAMAEAEDEEGTPSAEQQGDPNDTGTSPAVIDPDKTDGDNKIQDKNTPIPNDVHALDVDPNLDDTTDAERADGKSRTYQPGASKKSMGMEVQSGEVSHEAFEIPEDMPIYEDYEGTFIIAEGNKMYVDILEDSNEALPDDVHPINVEGEVEDTEDEDREGYTDVVPTQGEEADIPSTAGEKTEGVKERAAAAGKYMKDKAVAAGSYMKKKAMSGGKAVKGAAVSTGKHVMKHKGKYAAGIAVAGGLAYGAKKLAARGEKKESVNLYKLDKEHLIDTVLAMDEAVKSLQEKAAYEKACYDKLSDYTLRLESYTLKAEKVVESEKGEKDQARTEVVESVEYVKSLQEKIASLENTLTEASTYIEKLEENSYEVDQKKEIKSSVQPFVENLVVANPRLRPYQSDLMKCESISDVQELANRLKVNAGKIRLDAPMTEGVGPQQLNEGNFYTSKLKQRGMI